MICDIYKFVFLLFLPVSVLVFGALHIIPRLLIFPLSIVLGSLVIFIVLVTLCQLTF